MASLRSRDETVATERSVHTPDEGVKQKQSAGSFFQSSGSPWTIPFHRREQEGIVVPISPSGTATLEAGISPLQFGPPTSFAL